MTDDVSRQLVVIAIQATKFSFRLLAKGCQACVAKYQEQNVKLKAASKTKSGKMTVKDLVGQHQGASSIEVDLNTIPYFNRILRKYNVDYAIQKDVSTNPPRYLLFFKGKDTDVIAQALREIVHRYERETGKSLDPEAENQTQVIGGQGKEINLQEKTSKRTADDFMSVPPNVLQHRNQNRSGEPFDEKLKRLKQLSETRNSQRLTKTRKTVRSGKRHMITSPHIGKKGM